MATGIKTRTLTGNGSSAQNSFPIPLNYRRKKGEFEVSLRIKTDGSTTGATVQMTLDDPEGTYATDFNTDADWFDHSTLAGVTADAVGNIDFPVTAIRLRIDANGTDVIKMTAIQQGTA